MQRPQLEHIIRAAASITEDDEIYVLGSQSILGRYPEAPDDLTGSMEADVAPRNKPQLESLIEGSIGELSPFHVTFGYYADGVDTTALPLPVGWEGRIVLIQNQNTRLAKGLCLEPHDCAASKLIAGREKDIAFVRALLLHKLVDPGLLRERLPCIRNFPDRIREAEAALNRLARKA